MIGAALRQSVVELCIELSRRGHLAGTGGNVAMRLDEAHFAVTPSATDYFEMGPADVCVLRLSDLARVEGDRAPSVESGLHARVLRARRDVNCSIHTHQPVASACALLGEPLPVVEPALRRSLGAVVTLVGYAPSGTAWLSHKLARTLRADRNAYLLRNHGVLCCASSTDGAVQAVEDLEALARRHLEERITRQIKANPGRQDALARVLASLDS